MNFKQYVIEAKRTEIQREHEMRMFHGIVGFASEQAELQAAIAKNDRVNTLEEVGDMFWYIAILADAYDAVELVSVTLESYNPCQLTRPEFTRNEIAVTFSSLANQIKRNVFYGLDNRKMINDRIVRLAFRLSDMTAFCKCSIPDLLNSNINKLKIRYPEKWSQNKCLNRNVNSESKALEGSAE